MHQFSSNCNKFWFGLLLSCVYGVFLIHKILAWGEIIVLTALVAQAARSENQSRAWKIIKYSSSEHLGLLRGYPPINTERITTNSCMVKIWWYEQGVNSLIWPRWSNEEGLCFQLANWVIDIDHCCNLCRGASFRHIREIIQLLWIPYGDL